MIKGSRFLLLGRAGMDLYADPPGTQTEHAQTFSSALGGSAANIAVAIARLGGVVTLVSAVSNDAVGRFVINELKRYGVGVEHVEIAGGESRTSLAIVETRNENCQSVIYRNGAADFQIIEKQIRRISYEHFTALIVTGTCLATEASRASALLALELARKAGLTIILDVDYRPYSWSSREDAAKIFSHAAALCDIVVGNDEEFTVMAGHGNDGLAAAHKLAASTAKIVIYKMGERGSIAIHGERSFETAVFRVSALKPTGAGDAFMGAFVTSLASQLDLRTCTLRGAAAAAMVVTQVGCAPAMPTLAEIDHFIATHSSPTS